jgi:putative SOS response-associated peptidase YedK
MLTSNMCGRYVTPGETAIEREWSLVGPTSERWQRQNFNVTPSQIVPVIRSVEGKQELVGMRWGLIPFFAKGDPGPYSTINARIETVTSSPAYRTAWKRGQRCLVIAAGFYEWQVIEGGKQPYYITCADQPVFGFAGIWDLSTPPEGNPILSCSIVTLPASPLMAQIHNTKLREPAILRREDWDIWLTGSTENAFACLKQYADDLRSAWPVSRKVNNPKNNDGSLLERAAS